MPHIDPNKRRELARRWYQDHKVEIQAKLKARKVSDPAYRAYCLAKSKAWADRNQDRVRAQKQKCRQKTPIGAHHRKCRYGLTQEQFLGMLRHQGGACAVCRETPPRFCVDHDHRTGRVRGLLCYRCNCGVGHVERPGFVERVAEYLRKI